ncbi:MAG: hypothetical protein KBS98_03230 [Flavobacterium sp.]|nr:hypothetical protein [Candidatus Neoflavobacterium equi]
MLRNSLSSEEEQRVNNTLQRLEKIAFTPDMDATAVLDDVLKNLGLKLEFLQDMEGKLLVTQLEALHFNYEQMERFADFLALHQQNIHTLDKAVFLYEHLQENSGSFSLGIFNKLKNYSK